MPEFRVLEEWAAEHSIAFADREDLCRNEEVHKMMMERIETLQQRLAPYEQIKRFTLPCASLLYGEWGAYKHTETETFCYQ